ncbi:MAG TPA: stalk domain-containing protein [Candidatus Binatia bacterium]|nr:stalk domain-containing protein [Candidatus Binatia bacterium]
MRPFRQVVILAFCTLFSTVYAGAASDQGVPLASVARSAHLDYEWLTATRAVQLSGPGIVLVIRPGDYLYEVNDRVETTAVVPHYYNNDIYVSRALANHLINLARQGQLAVDAAVSQAVRAAAAEAQQARTDTNVEQLRGSIVLNVTPLKGAEAVLVTGTAPPTAPVMITLLATLSSQLPNVLLSRHTLTAGQDGRFQAIVPIASDYMRDTFIHVLATSLPGITSASAQLLVQEPNQGLKVPAEAMENGVWP